MSRTTPEAAAGPPCCSAGRVNSFTTLAGLTVRADLFSPFDAWPLRLGSALVCSAAATPPHVRDRSEPEEGHSTSWATPVGVLDVRHRMSSVRAQRLIASGETFRDPS